MLLLLARLFRQPQGKHAALLIGVVVGLLVAGGLAFAATDNVPVTTGLYWAVTTATTVGYGDVTPHNPSSRLIATLVMVTTIPLLGAAFALFTGSVTVSRLSRILHTEGARMAKPGFTLVVGMHQATPQLLDELARAHAEVVVVADVDAGRLPHDVKLVRGDPTDVHVLRDAEPERASQALVACGTDADTLVASVLLRDLAGEVPVSALASGDAVVRALKDLGVKQVISAELLVSHVLAKSLEAPHAGDLLLSLLDSERHKLVEETVDATIAGKTLSAVRASRDELLLGAVIDGRVSLGIGEDPVLNLGDTLLFGVAEKREAPAS